MIDLNLLNIEQRRAATTIDGPILILAGAGSGKTRVLTYRIAYLIEQGIYPGNILAITFTNKAAAEMKERVEKIVGDEAKKMWISTFHSTCVRMLRQDIDKLGYNKNFVIYDTGEQEKLIKECLKELNLDEKIYPPKDILGKIGAQKDILVDEEAYYKRYYNDFKTKHIAEVYVNYQKKLKNNNALDFDDIIMKMVKILKQYPDVLAYYQRKFRYIMVDEYQDTNRAQYEFINLLAREHKNLCVVGDDDQCIVSDMWVSTENGEVNINCLKSNDDVLCASGNGEHSIGTVNKILKKQYNGKVIKIKTKSGKEIVATPNHIGFVKVNSNPGVHYVYLMYKRNVGYRIGQTQGVRSRKGEIVNGLAVRLNQEHADKMWILKTCEDKAEASFYEHLYSIKYGIPTVVFHNCSRGISMSQEHIDKIFKDIDTYDAAERLMEDNMLNIEYPHHISGAVIRGQSARRIVNVCTFSGKKYKQSNCYSHRISLNTTGEDLKNAADKNNFKTRNGQRNTWRIETERKEYDEAMIFAKNIAQLEDTLEISKKAKLTAGKSFSYMPFAHMGPSMSIPVLYDGEIVEDIIETVNVENYNGDVYDLSIPHYRQFICQGIVVHNSIYGWRGADIANILDFEKDYHDAKVIKLEQNYRSTKTILEAANCVIVNNEKRKSKRLWTENPEGTNIRFYKADNDRYEVQYIINEIQKKFTERKDYNDFAVLYRTNAMSRVLEEGFVTTGIPYRVVGGLKFYDRKEVKDILGYLKLINNPSDGVSLDRIINVPKRGIGDSTVDKVKEYASQNGMTLFNAMKSTGRIESLTKRAAGAIDRFMVIMDNFIDTYGKIKVSDLINEILEKTGYIAELKEENTPENKSRIENLEELYSAAVEFEEKSEDNSLSAFLERVALVSDQDSISDNGGITLMTLHTAKGLEYPVVFIAGMEEGIFPHFSALESNEDLEEERRICYVGITRAKEELYLTCARQRMMFGRTMMNSVSSFISEIPEILIDDVSRKSNRDGFGRVYDYDNDGYTSDYNYGYNYSNSVGRTGQTNKVNSPIPMSGARSVNNVNKNEVKAGVKIKHKMFGKGLVIAVKETSGGKQITVQFDGLGLKNLILEASPIEVI